MSRFVRIPQENGDLIFVNTDHIEQIGFRPDQEKPIVYVFLVGAPAEDAFKVEFNTDAEAINFIEKNFIFFNA